MSMMKLMLPPVVSSGQYQIMESRIAMVEHIAMTDSAMIGPQWHNLLTSWRFSNVTKVEKKFIFLPQVITSILAVEFLKCTDQASVCYFLPLLSCKFSSADHTHIFSHLLSTQQLDWSWVTGALCFPQLLVLAKSSILFCQSALSLWQTQIPHLRDGKRNFTASEPVL